MAKLKNALAGLLGATFMLTMVSMMIWMYGGDKIAKETGLPVSRNEVFNMFSPHEDTRYEVGKQSNPALRHLDLKKHMLALTSQERRKAGVPAVTLGDNPAAQLHAEAALEGCYSGHWDRWGLKPNHRYTLTGGTGADAENVFGSDYCIKPYENYETISSMTEEVAEAVKGWMESPGHRDTMLDPAHTALNVGIAHDLQNAVMVQHFSSDYVTYETLPLIDQSGVLWMEAATSKASLEIGDSASVQICYDPPPKPLTRGQLSRTYSLCSGKQIAYIVKPLTGGEFYTDPEVKEEKQEHSCIDPYQINRNLPGPGSVEKADRAWAEAKAQSAIAPPIVTQVVRITANRLEKSDDHLILEADLSRLLKDHGSGIYTLVMWGRPNHISENAPISEQSIFWQTPVPPASPYIDHRQDRPTHLAIAPKLAKPMAVPTPRPPRETQPAETSGPTPAAPTIKAATIPPTPSENAAEPPGTPNIPAPVAIVIDPVQTEERVAPVSGIMIPVPPDTLVPVPPPTNRPALVPTPTPTLMPTPTPIPSPTATPLPMKETYSNQHFGYSIDHPYGWTTMSAKSETLIQDHAPTGGFLHVHRYPVQKDQSVGDLADTYMENMLRQAREWTHFDPSWGDSGTNDSGQLLVLEFTRRKAPADCLETGEAHIFRSKYVPKRLIGFSLTMAICEDSSGELRQEMGAFLKSFKEN